MEKSQNVGTKCAFTPINYSFFYHSTPLVRWLLHKYTYPVLTPTAKGTSITLPPLPYTTMGSDTICWGDNHLREFPWVIDIIYRDIF